MTKIAAVCKGQRRKEKGTGGWEERDKGFISLLCFLPSSSTVLPAAAAQAKVKPQTVSLRENNSYSFLVSCNSVPYRIKRQVQLFTERRSRAHVENLVKMLESWWPIAPQLRKQYCAGSSLSNTLSPQTRNYTPRYLSFYIQGLIRRYRLLTAEVNPAMDQPYTPGGT